MDAALEVFADSGFAGASLELICERAGMTRGAFYYNFASKEELFLAVINREFEDIMAVLPPSTTDAGDTTIVELQALFGALFSTRVNDFISAAMLTEEFRLQAMRDDATAQAYTQQFLKVHARVGDVFEKAAKAHGLTLAAAPETVAAIVTGVFVQAASEGVLSRMSEPELQSHVAERLAIIVKALVPGVL